MTTLYAETLKYAYEYDERHSEAIVYFDSWADLERKLRSEVCVCVCVCVCIDIYIYIYIGLCCPPPPRPAGVGASDKTRATTVASVAAPLK